jgi:dihydroflavonol-4-reductase
MKKVAVTGASGHIGANLVRLLLKRGYRVVALVRQSTRALDGLAVERVEGDVLDVDSLCRAFKGVELVFHLAAYISIKTGDQDKLESINVQGTANVLKACQVEAVATLVYFSSIHAIDHRPLERAVTEENSLVTRPQDRGSSYDYTKAQAERLVRSNGDSSLSTRIIYPTAVVGPNDFELSLFGQAVLKMAQGHLPALVAGGFDWVDVRDVAWAAIQAAEKGVDKDRFILSGHHLQMSEVAAVIESLTGVAAPRFTSPLWLARASAPLLGAWARFRHEEPLYTRVSLSALSSNRNISHARATEKFAYRPRPFHESMQDALSFYTRFKDYPMVTNGDGRHADT